MPEISSPAHPPIPAEVAGIDVNHCKNPACANFGVPASLVKFRRKAGTGLAITPGTAYSLVATGKSRPSLVCMLCRESFSLKSNLAVAEEVMRFAEYLLPADPPHCPNPDCLNFDVPLGTKGAYYAYGKTAAGTIRHRCRRCQRTFTSVGRATRRQRITHLNKTVLMALTNKMPLRRIAKVTGLSPDAIYGKIDFLYRQCLAFAGLREQALMQLEKPRLYVSVDRQDYIINWSQSADRRNIILRAAGSADNDTGYVFGMHVAYDPSLSAEAIEADAAAIHDAALAYPHRKYARLWLATDYEEALRESASERARRLKKAARGAGQAHLGCHHRGRLRGRGGA